MSAPAGIHKFLYSHYFYSGVRQSLGVLLPAFLLIGLLDHPAIGLAATLGALCASIIDQPGPHRHQINSMLGCVLLGTLATLATGLASSWPVLLWFLVIGQTLFFGFFTAFGRKAALVGFACLLLMTLTMHNSYTPEEAMVHAATSMAGGLWYIAFSWVVHRMQHLRQEQQTLAVSVLATAEYFAAKARFYEVTCSLDDAYLQLIPKQSALVEKQQAARDVVLRLAPRTDAEHRDPRRIMLWNIFMDMVDLQDTMLSTHTDYEVIRQALHDSDFLLFARDALDKLALEIDRIGLAISQDKATAPSTGIRAELRAMEYETMLLKKSGFAQDEPDAWIVVVHIQRRMRNASRIVERMHRHTRGDTTDAASPLRLDNSLAQFLSREEISLSRITSNLNMGSPHLRYALRLSLAVGAGILLANVASALASALRLEVTSHGYWVVLTILVIMKPGFALSWQRNRWRLLGTLIGCGLALGVLHSVHSGPVLLLVMLAASVLANSLLLLNYMASAVFNTVFVLLSFHFLAPGGSLSVVGERAIDTLFGSLVVLACSYVLPYWESRSVRPLAVEAISANRRFLQASMQPLTEGRGADSMAWRLARRNVHAAFANLVEAFYRMIREPKSKQMPVQPANDLMVQSHMLASQIAALYPMLLALPQRPPLLSQTLTTLEATLQAAETALTTPGLPQPATETADASETLSAIGRELDTVLAPLDTAADGPAVEPAQITYQLRQMLRTVQRIHDDAQALRPVPVQSLLRRNTRRSGSETPASNA